MEHLNTTLQICALCVKDVNSSYGKRHAHRSNTFYKRVVNRFSLTYYSISLKKKLI